MRILPQAEYHQLSAQIMLILSLSHRHAAPALSKWATGKDTLQQKKLFIIVWPLNY